MTAAARWTLVKSVFARALSVLPEGRTRWLKQQTSLPPAVVDEVLRMLGPGEGSAFELTEISPSRSPSGEATPQLAVGELLLERFVIAAHLGSGAMGDVYRATDRGLAEDVAIKTLRPHLLSQPGFVARLRREVQLARRVRHENVCHLFELHQDFAHRNGCLTFFTMELLEGETLADRLGRGRVDVEEAASIAGGIAQGLTAIHAASLIHRDLKPGNVFLVRAEAPARSRAVIADFGLCFDETRRTADSLSLFGPDAIVGTPAYMSPEQLLGRGATQASDIYSFGVLLFEMVTGRLPFEGDTPLALALRRLQQEHAPSPRAFVPDLPSSWERTIRACLSSEAAARPQAAADLMAALSGTRELPRQRRLTRRQIWTTGVAAGTLLSALPAWKLLQSRAAPHVPASDAVYHFKLGQEFAKQPSPEGIQNAVTELKRAVAIDPQYAEGWAELSTVYCTASNYSFIPSREARQQARAAAARALALDSRLANAHAALAYALAADLHRWREAEPSFRQAIELDAREPLVRNWYAGYLGRSGRFPEAIAMARSALQLDPGAFSHNFRLGTELFRARRYRESAANFGNLVRLHPAESSGLWALARNYEWLKRFDEAEAMLHMADGLPNKSSSACYWATLEAARGNRKRALKLVEQVRRAWAERHLETNSLLAVLGALGAIEEIVSTMTEGIKREDETVLAAFTNAYLDLARSDPRVHKLLADLGFA